jgi:CRISPR/Cas system CMR subunit Cmr6 (Cas7 group RAMP superfamily)
MKRRMAKMEYPVELLLSDEYIEFSQKVADLHVKKKLLKEEFKTKLDELQKKLKDDCKNVDAEAKVLVKNWESWALQQSTGQKGEKDVR